MSEQHTTGQVAASAAEIYDTFFVPALFAKWPPHLLNAAQVKTGHQLLDVACGTGILAQAAAERVGAAGSVTGIDINEGMLAIARHKAPHITWQVGPAEGLPYEDGRFDRVVSQFGLMFFQDQPQALAEMCRVTKPEGTVAVAVWGALEATPGYKAVAQLLHEIFGPEVAQSIEAPYSLGDRDKLGRLFEKAGIQDFSVETITGTVRFSSLEDWIFTDIKGWTLADVVDEAGYEKFRQAAHTKLAQFVQADGSVVFDAPAHIVTAAV